MVIYIVCSFSFKFIFIWCSCQAGALTAYLAWWVIQSTFFSYTSLKGAWDGRRLHTFSLQCNYVCLLLMSFMYIRFVHRFKYILSSLQFKKKSAIHTVLYWHTRTFSGNTVARTHIHNSRVIYKETFTHPHTWSLYTRRDTPSQISIKSHNSVQSTQYLVFALPNSEFIYKPHKLPRAPRTGAETNNKPPTLVSVVWVSVKLEFKAI